MTKRMATKRTHAQVVRFHEAREKKIAYKNIQNRLSDLYGDNIIMKNECNYKPTVAVIIVYSWAIVLTGLGVVFLFN